MVLTASTPGHGIISSSAAWPTKKNNSKQLFGIFHTTIKRTYADRVDIDIGDDPVFPLHLFSIDRKRQTLVHDSVLLNDLHTRRLEVLRVVVIDFGAVQEPTSPCKGGGSNGVCACLVALLVLAVVPGNSAYREKNGPSMELGVAVGKLYHVRPRSQ